VRQRKGLLRLLWTPSRRIRAHRLNHPEAIVRARYSAYGKNMPKYIVASTHPDSKDMKRKDDPAEAREQIEKDADATMQNVQFKSLRVNGTK
jgi:Uncharacterized protein conserved in bacteria